MTTSTKLYAIVLQLRALHNGAVNPYQPDMLRAALFDFIRRGEPQLAENLRSANRQKPFTVGWIDGGVEGPDGELHFGAGASAQWRFTLLGQPLFESLVQRCAADQARPHLRFGAVSFAIEDVFIDPRRHDASGMIPLETLADAFSDPSRLTRSLTLNFITPTVYKFGEHPDEKFPRWQLFPAPRLVFSVLRKGWEALGGAQPGDEYDDWAETHLFPLEYQLQTFAVTLREHRRRIDVPGFVGAVTYTCLGDARYLGLTHALARFAFWRGAGYQTTCGLGQVRPQP
jgi:CRISPR-associated endoribonuclease Cas6